MFGTRFHRRFALKGMLTSPLLPLVGASRRKAAAALPAPPEVASGRDNHYRGRRVVIRGDAVHCMFEDCVVLAAPGARIFGCSFRGCRFPERFMRVTVLECLFCGGEPPIRLGTACVFAGNRCDAGPMPAVDASGMRISIWGNTFHSADSFSWDPRVSPELAAAEGRGS